MKVLKIFSLILLSLILFLLLTVFGFAFTVNQVALNPNAINSIIRDIDIAGIARTEFEQNQSEQSAESKEIEDTVLKTIVDIQPLIKEKLHIAIDDTYAYLLGKNKTPDIQTMLSDNLNADFIEQVLAKIDLSNLVEQILNEQSPNQDSQTAELQQALLTTMKNIEPDLKHQIAAASDPTIKYVLGQTESLDLKTVARNTLLSNSFMGTVIDNLDTTAILKDTIKKEIEPLPEGITLTDEQLNKISIILEPVIKSKLKPAASQLADYIVGNTSNFSLTISIESVLSEIKPVIREAFLSSNPDLIQGATQAQIDATVELYWNEVTSTIPADFTLDSTTFDSGTLSGVFTDMQDSLAQARLDINTNIHDVEDTLSQIRTIINYFQIAFYGLIGLILVFIGGIILIHHSVTTACRNLGIIFTVYGALELAGVMIVRQIVPITIQNGTNPPPQAIIDQIPRLLKDLTGPLFTLSLVCLILGIAMIVLSFVYPNMQIKKNGDASTSAPPAVNS